MEKRAKIEDGEIVFEWYAGAGDVAVIAVGSDYLSWSGVIGSRTYSGKAALPQEAIDMLARLPSREGGGANG